MRRRGYDVDIPRRRVAAPPRGYDVDVPWGRVATPRLRRGNSAETSRGAAAGLRRGRSVGTGRDAVATTWTFRGDGSRRRRGCDADVPWRPRGQRQTTPTVVASPSAVVAGPPRGRQRERRVAGRDAVVVGARPRAPRDRFRRTPPARLRHAHGHPRAPRQPAARRFERRDARDVLRGRERPRGRPLSGRGDAAAGSRWRRECRAYVPRGRVATTPPRRRRRDGAGGPSARVFRRRTAQAGTMLLEFARLSRLTGDRRFATAARGAVDALWRRRGGATNLVGSNVDTHTGRWLSQTTGVGAGVDSFYESRGRAEISSAGSWRCLGRVAAPPRVPRGYSAGPKKVPRLTASTQGTSSRPRSTRTTRRCSSAGSRASTPRTAARRRAVR